MTEDQQKWLRHCSYECVRSFIFPQDNENHNEDLAFLIENGYLKDKRGIWTLSDKGQAYMEKLKEEMP